VNPGPGPSPTAVEVFGANEQSDVEVDVVRWVRLAQLVLVEERVPGVGGRQPDQGGRGPGAPAEAGEPPSLIGDVVVCPRVAAAQAPEHGWTTEEELALLVVHGVLHLLNYDHADPREHAAMQRRERELLARFRELEQQGD
jgi:rRNA maturation RNase YbeY